MKKVFIILLLLANVTRVFSQSLPLQGEDYFTIVENHVTDNDPTSEGSSFNAFQAWKWYWGPRLYPHGNFESYTETWASMSMGNTGYCH